MSGLSEWFGWNASSNTKTIELPEIFPIGISKDNFIKTDIINIYSKILTDVCERTHGLKDEQIALLWDNCLKSEAGDGLITLLAKAMTDKKDLFIVYEMAVNVIRVATSLEAAKIKADYEKQNKSGTGIFISFKNYSRSDMVKLYSGLEFATVSGLNKSLGLSSAIMFKMNDLRASVSLADSSSVSEQAAELCKALGEGQNVYMDAKDVIDTASPDVSAVKESITFINQKRSFYLGMPESYINGEQTGGIGSSGENDARAVERGLKNYYFSIVKPALEAIFGGSYSYKSQDARQILGSMEVLKTFALVDEELISLENKTKIINQLLDLPEKSKGDPIAKVDVTTPPATPKAKAPGDGAIAPQGNA
jgi:hypothetical protein